MRILMRRVKAAWRSLEEWGSLLCGRKLRLKQKGRLYKENIRKVFRDMGQEIVVWVRKN